MDGWHFALYAFSVYLAVRTLVALMRAHEQDLRRTLAAEAAARKDAAKVSGAGRAG